MTANAAETRGASMPGSVSNGSVRILAQGSRPASRGRFRTRRSWRVPERAGSGALGLVLIGGLGHVRASRVLGICPRDMAALLRTALLRLATSSAALAETAEEQEKDDAETRIRHGDHPGSGRSRARGDGGQVAAGCAAVRGDEEDVTRAASRSLAASRPRPAVTVTMSGPRTVNGTPMRG